METRISKFFTSLGAVILPMVILLTALIIDGAVLLFRSFPQDISYWVKLVACVLLGFALAWSLLLTSVNSYLLKKKKVWGRELGFAEVFMVCTVLLSLFFFGVFELGDVHWSRYALAVFLSVLFGVVEYLYCFIFVAKYREKVERDDFERLYNEQKGVVLKLELDHREVLERLKRAQADSNELQRELAGFKKALTCAYCGEVSDSISKHKRHVAGCEKRKGGE